MAIMLTGCLLAACNDVLDKEPLTQPSSSSYLANKKQVEQAIIGAHSPLQLLRDQVPFTVYFEEGSDIGANRSTNPETLFFTTTSGTLSSIWTNLYRCVSRCNFILDNISRAKDDMTDEEMNNYIAQAKTLRAFCYMYLCSLWGDVPLVDHVQTLSEGYMAKTPKSEVVDFIINQCKEAAPNLTKENKPNTMTISQGFAYAIIARTALYNERWQEAIDACQKIMDMEGDQYVLDSDYANLTMVKGKTSKEIIWAIQFYADLRSTANQAPKVFASRMAGGYCNKMPVQALVDSYECTDGLSIDKSPLYNPQDPWKNRDPRLGYTVALPGSVFMGYQFETHKDSTKCWNYNVTPARRVTNQDAVNTYASFSGYCWRKYVDQSEWRSDGFSSINAIVFRYAEILLTYAEAKIESNQIDQSVYTAINRIRRRVGMPDIPSGETQEELRCRVRKERKYELAGEGQRLFDILRWKTAEKVLNGMCYGRVPRGYPTTAPTIDKYGDPDYSNFSEASKFGTKLGNRNFDPNKNYVAPIPDSEIQTNTNLVQNPNY